jgi:hypothetical protein
MMMYFPQVWKAVTIAAIVLTSYQPAQAASFKVPSAVVAGEGIAVDVRSRRRHGGGRKYRGRRHHRGGRNYGSGIALGIIGGVILGGIIAESNRRRNEEYDNSNAHFTWCTNRYRSYISRSNTWVAYSGQVRQCISPYN